MKYIVLFIILLVNLALVDTGFLSATLSHNAQNKNEFISVTNQIEFPSNSNETKIITHEMGETEIAGIPERIVALEFIYAEDLLTLGIQPVGVADIAIMDKWVNLKNYSLENSTVDVGTRAEPNLEIISQLEPDLIIGDIENNELMYEQLSQIAPTLLFNPYPGQEENTTSMERMEEEFTTIADIVGKNQQGSKVLVRMNQKIENASRIVETTDLADHKFVVAMGYTFEGATTIRLSTNTSNPVEILQRMGLENAWNKEYGQWGYSEIGLETLSTVGDANFFYIAQEDDDIFLTTYKNNPVWSSLEFVKEGRTYPLGGNTWVYGGPISAEVIAEKVVESIKD